jgi:hypothetical protein
VINAKLLKGVGCSELFVKIPGINSARGKGEHKRRNQKSGAELKKDSFRPEGCLLTH